MCAMYPAVVSTLLNFVRMFVKALEENRKQLEFEKKKGEKETEKEKGKLSPCTTKSEIQKMRTGDGESKQLIETQ